MSRLAALVAVLLALGVLGACGTDDPDIPTRVVTVEPDPPGSPQTLGPLTRRQLAEAKRIIAGDIRFRRIVGDHRYRLTRTIPFGAQDNRGSQPREVFIGTRSEVILRDPRPSVTTTWPLMDFAEGAEEAKEPTYNLMTARLTVRGLRSLIAFTDLKRHRLAGLSPEKTDEVIWPPGWPTIRKPSGQ